MSWLWGSGKKGGPTEKTDAAPSNDFVVEKTDVASGGDEFGGTNFASAPSVGPSRAQTVGGQQAALQQAVMQEQQRAIIEQVMGRLTEVAFEQCINRPQDGLGRTEKQCINATVQKYFDTTEFVQGRYQRQAAAQQQLN